MDIGKRIRDLREERGLTQREVARRAGLTPSGVGFIEHGQTRNPSAETVVAIARALGVPVEELLEVEETAPLANAPQGTGRDEWDAAVRNARQLREHAQGRTEELLVLWQESKDRKEDAAERRAYLDEIRELLQQAYDARPTLFEAMSYELLPEQWPELGEADQFYRGLWDLVQSAGLNIRTGKAQEERPKAVDEPEAA